MTHTFMCQRLIVSSSALNCNCAFTKCVIRIRFENWFRKNSNTYLPAVSKFPPKIKKLPPHFKITLAIDNIDGVSFVAG